VRVKQARTHGDSFTSGNVWRGGNRVGDTRCETIPIGVTK